MELASCCPWRSRAARVMAWRVAPGSAVSPSPRGRDLFELVFIEAGEGRQRIGTRTYQASTGLLFLIAPWEINSPVCQDGTSRWIVAFETDSLLATAAGTEERSDSRLPEDLLLAAFLQTPESGERSLLIEASQRARWVARFTNLADELAGDSFGATVAAHALLKLLLVDVARLARLRLDHLSSQTRPILFSVFAFIEQRFRAPIGLADVAKAVARSPSYLTDLVRRETGRTVQQWIIHRRMAEAKLLLSQSTARVKDIGSMIGYDDTGHFIRQFRRVNGLTPHRWRLGCAAERAPAQRENSASHVENPPCSSFDRRPSLVRSSNGRSPPTPRWGDSVLEGSARSGGPHEGDGNRGVRVAGSADPPGGAGAVAS